MTEILRKNTRRDHLIQSVSSMAGLTVLNSCGHPEAFQRPVRTPDANNQQRLSEAIYQKRLDTFINNIPSMEIDTTNIPPENTRQIVNFVEKALNLTSSSLRSPDALYTKFEDESYSKMISLDNHDNLSWFMMVRYTPANGTWIESHSIDIVWVNRSAPLSGGRMFLYSKTPTKLYLHGAVSGQIDYQGLQRWDSGEVFKALVNMVISENNLDELAAKTGTAVPNPDHTLVVFQNLVPTPKLK
jgi:hypothetical protein